MKGIDNSAGTGQVAELESIRGVAAVVVVLYHIQGWSSIFQGLPIVKNAGLMVDVFFVLSGYVIYTAYGSRIRNPTDLLRFQFLRFGRLYPVHVVLLLAFLVLEVGKLIALQFLEMSTYRYKPFDVNNLLAFFQQALMIQAIGPTGNILTYNGPAWSISVEFYTYFVFALLLLTISRMKIFVFFSISFLSLVAIYQNFFPSWEGLLRCFSGFFLGCLTAIIGERPNYRFSKSIPFSAAFALGGILSIERLLWTHSIVVILTAILILSIMKSEVGFFRKILQTRILGWLGKISYSLYMTHGIVLYLSQQVLAVILKRPREVGSPKILLSLGESLLVDLSTMLVILFVSWMMFKFIENPARLRSRGIASSWKKI